MINYYCWICGFFEMSQVECVRLRAYELHPSPTHPWYIYRWFNNIYCYILLMEYTLLSPLPWRWPFSGLKKVHSRLRVEVEVSLLLGAHNKTQLEGSSVNVSWDVQQEEQQEEGEPRHGHSFMTAAAFGIRRPLYQATKSWGYFPMIAPRVATITLLGIRRPCLIRRRSHWPLAFDVWPIIWPVKQGFYEI